MDHTLTRDAKKALATIYKAYKSRRASGEAKSSAVYFDTESHDAAAIDAAVSDNLAELSTPAPIITPSSSTALCLPLLAIIIFAVLFMSSPSIE